MPNKRRQTVWDLELFFRLKLTHSMAVEYRMAQEKYRIKKKSFKTYFGHWKENSELDARESEKTQTKS